MHSVAAVLGLVPIILILQGCGSGGGGKAGADCTNPKMKLVSQSVDMAGSFEVQSAVPNATQNVKMQIPVTLSEKIDMEYMKWFAAYSYVFSVPDERSPGSPTKEAKVDVKAMLDVAGKKAAIGIKGIIPGLPEQLNNCSFVSLPWLGPVETVSKCVKDGFEAEGLSPPMVPGVAIEGPACVQDGEGLDVWTIKMQMEGKSQPQLPAQMISVSESYKLDKNSLFREIEMNTEVGKVATVYGSIQSKSEPKQIGPSDEDIDADKWGFGKCTEMPVTPPALVQQLLTALSSKPGASSIVPLMMKAKSHQSKGRRLQGGTPGVPGDMPPPAWAKCFMPPGPQPTPQPQPPSPAPTFPPSGPPPTGPPITTGLKCTVCAHVYDPMKDCGGKDDPSKDCGPSGVPFENLPADWKCPVCSQGKDKYVPITAGDGSVQWVEKPHDEEAVVV